MWVTDYAIEVALLRIFRDYRVFHPGASLLLSDIRKAWARTGLRSRDIEAGLALLSAGDFVSVEDTADGDRLVTLRPNGSARLTLLPRHLGELFEEMDALMILRAARLRRRTEFWHDMRLRMRGYPAAGADAPRQDDLNPPPAELPPTGQ